MQEKLVGYLEWHYLYFTLKSWLLYKTDVHYQTQTWKKRKAAGAPLAELLLSRFVHKNKKKMSHYLFGSQKCEHFGNLVMENTTEPRKIFNMYVDFLVLYGFLW